MMLRHGTQPYVDGLGIWAGLRYRRWQMAPSSTA